MSDSLRDKIVKTNEIEWKPLIEEGVETSGLFMKYLRYDPKTRRSPTFVMKFEPGSSYPFHNHPAGEEAYVLEGSVFFDDIELCAGEYLYIPPDHTHAVRSEQGCVALFVVPEEVELL